MEEEEAVEENLLASLETRDGDALGQFVDQYADRVEFLEARRLLLFRGGCKGTVTGVFPVTNEQVEALVDLR